MDWIAFGAFLQQAGPFLASLIVLAFIIYIIAKNTTPAMQQIGSMWATANTALATTMELMRQDVNRLQSQVDQKDDIIQALRADRDRLFERVEELEGQEKARVNELETLRSELAEARSEMDGQVKELQARVKDLEAENSRLRQELGEVQADRKKVQRERDQLETEVKELRGEIASLRARLDAQNGEAGTDAAATSGAGSGETEGS